MNKINSLQISTIIFNQIISLSLGLYIFNIKKIDNTNSYITLILSFFINIIPLLLIIYISNYKPNLNIIEKINYLFNKNIAKIINLINTLIILFISIILLFSISNFIIKEYLPNTNIIYVSIIYAIIIYIINTKGIEIISRTSIFLPIISIIYIIIIIIGLTPQINIYNLIPTTNKNIINTSILYSFISSTYLYGILIIPKNDIIDKENYNKTILISYIISFITILIFIIIFNILIKTNLLNNKFITNYYPYILSIIIINILQYQ